MKQLTVYFAIIFGLVYCTSLSADNSTTSVGAQCPMELGIADQTSGKLVSVCISNTALVLPVAEFVPATVKDFVMSPADRGITLLTSKQLVMRTTKPMPDTSVYEFGGVNLWDPNQSEPTLITESGKAVKYYLHGQNQIFYGVKGFQELPGTYDMVVRSDDGPTYFATTGKVVKAPSSQNLNQSFVWYTVTVGTIASMRQYNTPSLSGNGVMLLVSSSVPGGSHLDFVSGSAAHVNYSIGGLIARPGATFSIIGNVVLVVETTKLGEDQISVIQLTGTGGFKLPQALISAEQIKSIFGPNARITLPDIR